MRSDSKEKILVELRQYHLDALPEKLASATMDKYRAELGLLQDQVINMLLGYINRKTGFVNFSTELAVFKKKVAVTKRNDQRENDNRVSFVSKAEGLLKILDIARAFKFTVRPPRHSRPAVKVA